MAIHFFTGKPCKRGHVSPRLISTRQCTACLSERKKLNPTRPDPVGNKRRNAAYRARRRKAILERIRMWKAANRDAVNQKERARYAANIDRSRSNSRINGANRRARLLAVGGTFSISDVKAIFKRQRGRCASPVCRKLLRKRFHIDHIVPVSRGGPNWPKNLQLLCATCNASKGAKDPIEYVQSMGMLI